MLDYSKKGKHKDKDSSENFTSAASIYDRTLDQKERVKDREEYAGLFLWVKINDKVIHTTGIALEEEYGTSPSWDENIEWY